MRHKTVLTAATAVILALGATAASAAGTSPAKGNGSGPAKKEPGQCAPAQPDSKLDQVLRNVKIALAATGGKLTDRIVASFAKDMGMSTAQARKFLTAIFVEGRKPGAPKPGTSKPGPANVFTAAQLAKVLDVPLSKAQAALDMLQKMATGPKGTIDEGSRAFAAAAKTLGVTPQRLAKAILQLKTAAGGKPVCKPAPGKGDTGKGDPGKSHPGKGIGKPKTLILR